MTATATSIASGYEAAKALDGNNGTFWHDDFTCGNCPPALPQSITLALGGTYNVSTLRYLPRQDVYTNGTITTYNVYVSSDGINFTKVVSNGSWAQGATEKTTSFGPVSGAYVRLEAVAGVGGYASAAEINVGVVVSSNPASVNASGSSGTKPVPPT